MRRPQRYAGESPVVIRISTKDLFAVNRPALPLFSHHDSGSTCYVSDRASSRGPDTFVCEGDFPYLRSQVVEMVLREQVILPSTSKICAIYLLLGLSLEGHGSRFKLETSRDRANPK